MYGVPMFSRVVTKLKRLKRELKMLNKQRFSNLEQATEEAMAKLRLNTG